MRDAYVPRRRRRPRAAATPIPACSTRAFTRRQGRDRWIAITSTRPQRWHALRTLHGVRARDATARDAALRQWCAAQKDIAAVEDLQELGIAAGVVQDMQDLFERDPLMQARHRWCHCRTRCWAPSGTCARRSTSRAHAARRFARPRWANTTARSRCGDLRPVGRAYATSCKNWESSSDQPIEGQRSRKDLACTAEATAYQRAVRRRTQAPRHRQRRAVRHRAGRHAARDLPRDGHSADQQPVVVGLHLGQATVARAISTCWTSSDIRRNSCQLLLARPGVHARQRSGDGALGRPAETDGAGGAPDLRVHPPRLRPMGRGAGHRVLSAGGARLEAQGPGLVHALEHRMGRASTSRDRIDLLVKEMRELIELLERKHRPPLRRTKSSSRSCTRSTSRKVTSPRRRALIGEARPCPVSIADQMPNTMIPQWHRGSDWAVAHARRFRDEVG